MADDLSQAINQLQQMLNSEDGTQKLNEMVNAIGGMFGGNGQNVQSEDVSGQKGNTEEKSSDGFNLDFLLKAKDIFDQIGNQKDDKTALLNALRPYLRKERIQKLDMVIKLVSLTKLGAVMGDMKNFL